MHSLIPNTTEAIESALDGEPGPPLRSEQRATIAELGLVGGQVPDSTPGDGRRNATVTIPVRSKAGDSDRVFLPDAGIYPVSVRLLQDGDELDTVTLPLIRLGRSPTDRPRLVHLIRTISGGPSLQLDGAAKPSTGDLTELRALTEQLATVPADADTSALSVSLPAELLDTLAIAGSPEEAQVVDGLAKVADRATWLSSPYVPLNLGVWAAADVAQNPALTISYDVAQRRLSDLLDVEVNDALVPPDWTLAAPTVGFLADRGATTVLLDPNVVRSGDQPGAATSVEGTTVNAADRRTRQTEQPEDTNTGSVKASLPALTVSDFDLTTETDRSDADPDTNPTVDAVGVARQLALLSAAPLANEERLGDPTDGSDADRPTGPFDVVALRVPDSLADGQLGALVASLSEATGVLAPVDADGLVKAVGRASSASRSNGGHPRSRRSSCATPPSPSSGPWSSPPTGVSRRSTRRQRSTRATRRPSWHSASCWWRPTSACPPTSPRPTCWPAAAGPRRCSTRCRWATCPRSRSQPAEARFPFGSATNWPTPSPSRFALNPTA